MSTLHRLLGNWPSLAVLARDLDASYNTVAAWKRRGAIPVTYWPGVVASASRNGIKGVTNNSLLQAHQRAPKNVPPRPGEASTPQ